MLAQNLIQYSVIRLFSFFVATNVQLNLFLRFIFEGGNLFLHFVVVINVLQLSQSASTIFL